MEKAGEALIQLKSYFSKWEKSSASFAYDKGKDKGEDKYRDI